MTTLEHHDGAEAWRYAQKSMDWYGWGSPVGLGLFFAAVTISISGSLALLRLAGLL